MFVDEVSTKESLVRMIRRATPNHALRDDLLQEALIHLWLTEARRPGQTKSWYLQSCKYHLLHYLASGRSVDSAKRHAGQLPPGRDAEGRDEFLEQVDSGNTVLNWVSARDIISSLSPQLLPRERAVLHCFLFVRDRTCSRPTTPGALWVSMGPGARLSPTRPRASTGADLPGPRSPWQSSACARVSWGSS